MITFGRVSSQILEKDRQPWVVKLARGFKNLYISKGQRENVQLNCSYRPQPKKIAQRKGRLGSRVRKKPE